MPHLWVAENHKLNYLFKCDYAHYLREQSNAINAAPQKRVLHFECNSHYVYAAYGSVREAVAYRMHVAAALANGNWNSSMFGIMSATRINNSARNISVPGHVPGQDGDVARNPQVRNDKQQTTSRTWNALNKHHYRKDRCKLNPSSSLHPLPRSSQIHKYSNTQRCVEQCNSAISHSRIHAQTHTHICAHLCMYVYKNIAYLTNKSNCG